jgi:glycosyltransferase involved in cell wall biosynthesis
MIEFDKIVDEEFKVRTAINDLVYFHNPKATRIVKDLPYSDIKRNEFYKNLIYLGDSVNGTFNGYISWIKNLGRCFSDKYDITILYDHITPKTYSAFSKYFKCIERSNSINYVCDSLSVTYSTYFYPKNIFTLSKNYMFIHGNMSDYPNSRVFHDDIYSNYVAVSKIAAEKAMGYFPTSKIEHIINPFKLDKDLVQPHITLTSAFRYSDVKRPDRVIKIAEIFDELNIPYTWNVFTDKKENTNKSGLIFRSRVENPIPYVQDSDYFVLLSDSEAMPYCVLEALAVNTKVILTPLDAYKELDIRNGDNGYIIPFDYFEDQNKDKLVKLMNHYGMDIMTYLLNKSL